MTRTATAVCRVMRTGAVLIAIAGVVDPAIALHRRSPLAVDVRLPVLEDPSFADADRVRASVLAMLGDSVKTDGSDPAGAVMAIGNARPGAADGVPVFAVASPSVARLSAVAVTTAAAHAGQRQLVTVRFDAGGLNGRATDFTLSRQNARLAAVQHRWTRDVETFDADFDFVMPAIGTPLELLRVSADTATAPTARVDVAVSVGSRRVRVLVYEPRPSWTAGFVRRALEADALFEVSALALTSRGVVTRSASGPPSLATLDLDAVDVIVLGGLEALSTADIATLERFTEKRGGALLLLPDGRLPERVSKEFGLPEADEVLLDRATEVRSGTEMFRASELLLPRPAAAMTTVASVTQGGGPKTAVAAFARGAGQVVMSGALDAWRYRGDSSEGFSRMWRGIVADSGLHAVPALALEVDPRVTRPGDQITIRATLRETEWIAGPGEIRFPPLSASLTGVRPGSDPPTPGVRPRSDPETFLRLWPAAAPGVYEARIAAPPAGRYTVRVEAGRRSVETPVIVEASAATVTPDYSAEWNRLAAETGGATFDSGHLLALVQRLRALGGREVAYRARPLRSVWWVLPFAALLTVEWTLRRRGGLR